MGNNLWAQRPQSTVRSNMGTTRTGILRLLMMEVELQVQLKAMMDDNNRLRTHLDDAERRHTADNRVRVRRIEDLERELRDVRRDTEGPVARLQVQLEQVRLEHTEATGTFGSWTLRSSA